MRKINSNLLPAFTLCGAILLAAAAEAAQPRQLTMRQDGIPSQTSPIKELDHRSRKAPIVTSRPEAASFIPPQKITAGGTTLYGWSLYNSMNKPKGLYTVEESGLELKWIDSFDAENHYYVQDAMLVDGKIYGQAIFSYLGDIKSMTWVEYDFETGEVTGSENWTPATDPYYERLVYSPKEDCFYGVGKYAPYDGGESYLLLKAPVDSPKDAAVIRTFGYGGDLASAICMDEDQQGFYIITNSGTFKHLELDGTETTLFNINLPDINFGYYMGMVYSPVEKLIYFNAMNYGISQSYLATIDPKKENGDVKLLYSFPDNNQLISLITTDGIEKDLTVPAAPEISAISFENGSASGYIEIKAPETLLDGTTPIASNVSLTALVDGNAYYQADAEPGKTLRVEYADLEQGFHKFGFYASKDGKESRETSMKVYIGYDVPAAPANVVLTENNVSWDAVGTSLNNGYLDAGSIMYTVTINSEKYGETRATSFPITLPDSELKIYTAEVTASNHGVESATGISNKIRHGKPLSLPVYIKQPTDNDFLLCDVIDRNNDGRTWTLNPGMRCFCADYSFYDVNDDWLILPPFEMKESNKYISFGYDARIRSVDYCDETLSVYIGSTPDPDAMKCIVEEYRPAADFEHIEKMIQLENPGTYYIAFRSTSAAYQMGILVDNISIEDNNTTPLSPARVSGITAVPAEQGGLSATISFKMPETLMNGDAISASDDLKAVVSSEAESKNIAANPGETVTVTIATVQSENSIRILSSIGELNSPASVIDVYTGVYPPASPEITKEIVSPDMMSLSLEWNPVTTAHEEGKYLDPEKVFYNIYRIIPSNLGGIWALIEEGVTDCSYTITLPENNFQGVYQYGVESANAAGSNGQGVVVQDLLGTPYALPMEETFADMKTDTEPWINYRPDETYTCSWGVGLASNILPGIIEEDTYAILTMGEIGSNAMMGMPRFSTKGEEHVAVTFNAYTGFNCPKITILGTYSGCQEDIVVGTFADGNYDEVKPITFQLPDALLGHEWVQLYIKVEFSEENQIALFTNILVESGSSSVDSTSAIRTIYGGKDYVSVLGMKGEQIVISDLQGIARIKGTVGSDFEKYPLEKGVYVAKAGDMSLKVIVK